MTLCYNKAEFIRSVAQLVEHRSPKPAVGGSRPLAPANMKANKSVHFFSMQQTRNLSRNVLNIDFSKVSHIVLIFAVLSFFAHLVLHNYNILKKKSLSVHDFTRSIDAALSKAATDLVITKEEKPHLDVKNEILEAKQNVLRPSIIKKLDINIKPVKHKLQSKKIGNVAVFGIKKGDTIYDVIHEIGFDAKKSTAIADSISKKYKLTNIRSGDVIQAVNLTKTLTHLRVTIINKAEIIVKEKNGKYNVLINNLTKIPDLFPKVAIKKFKLSLVKGANEIHKAPVTQDIKRDLLSIVQLLKQEKFNVANLELIYEQQSTKSDTLCYVDAHNNEAKVRVYKYRDKTGAMHYVKQNGMILSREKAVSAAPAFRLAYPIQNPVFGSGFGMRSHPIIRKVRMHHGIDFRAGKGTPVVAPANGVIVEMTSGRGFGKHIRMRHNSTYTTLYAHLDNFAKDKRVGVRVAKGEIIGYVGRTGLATGEHLHFEVHENGRPINPFRIISNAAVANDKSLKQLSPKQMSRFRIYQAEIERKVKVL